MNEVSIRDAAVLFDDIEKWGTFLDLYANKEKFVDLWYSQLIDALKEKLRPDPGKWQFRKWQPRSWGFYAATSDQESLVILYENNNFCLWINEGQYDTAKILAEFNKKSLFTGFFEGRHIRKSGAYLAVRETAIVIDNIKNPDLLAWYGAHKGKEQEQFLNELYGFFSFFMNDAEIYRQIEEINRIKK